MLNRVFQQLTDTNIASNHQAGFITLSPYMTNKQCVELATMCIQEIQKAFVGNNIEKLILAQLLFMQRIDLLEERSPLEVEDIYLVENENLRKKAIQAYFLINYLSTEKDNVLTRLGYGSSLPLKNYFHKVLSKDSHQSSPVDCSILNWDEQALNYYTAYQYYKMHDVLPLNASLPEAFKQLFAPEYKRTDNTIDELRDPSFNPLHKLHGFKFSDKVNIFTLKQILMEFYFEKNTEATEASLNKLFVKVDKAQYEKLICKYYILFEIFMKNDMGSRDFIRRSTAELGRSFNLNENTALLFKPAKRSKCKGKLLRVETTTPSLNKSAPG